MDKDILLEILAYLKKDYNRLQDLKEQAQLYDENYLAREKNNVEKRLTKLTKIFDENDIALYKEKFVRADEKLRINYDKTGNPSDLNIIITENLKRQDSNLYTLVDPNTCLAKAILGKQIGDEIGFLDKDNYAVKIKVLNKIND